MARAKRRPEIARKPREPSDKVKPGAREVTRHPLGVPSPALALAGRSGTGKTLAKVPPRALARQEGAEAATVLVDPAQVAPWQESLKSTGVVARRVPVGGRREGDLPFDPQALALRENLRRAHKLSSAGELLLADLLVAAAMDFEEILRMSISEECRGITEYIGNLLDLRRRSADHVLKLLTALREFTAPAITVKVGQANNVNVAHQQISVGSTQGASPGPNDYGKV